VVVAVTAFQYEDPEEKGVYLNPHMMAAMCTFGSDIGDKMELAHRKCSGENEGKGKDTGKWKGKDTGKWKGKDNGKWKGKGNGKGLGGSGGWRNTEEDDCSLDLYLLIQFFTDVWDKKACVLKEAGWLDEEGMVLDSAIMADISSLPDALAQGLVDTRDLCRNRSMEATLEHVFQGQEEGMEEGESNNCVPKVDPAELVELELVLQKLTFFRCVHENFMEGCGNYILQAVQSMDPSTFNSYTTPGY